MTPGPHPNKGFCGARQLAQRRARGGGHARPRRRPGPGVPLPGQPPVPLVPRRGAGGGTPRGARRCHQPGHPHGVSCAALPGSRAARAAHGLLFAAAVCCCFGRCIFSQPGGLASDLVACKADFLCRLGSSQPCAARGHGWRSKMPAAWRRCTTRPACTAWMPPAASSRTRLMQAAAAGCP